MLRRKAFTLVEVLVSVALLSIVMLGLYSALGMQRSSNKHLFDYLTKALDADKVIMVLYRDIMHSDGNLTIKKGEFSRLCIENTSNSLYGLSRAKVCWLVAKEDNQLLRVEGNSYKLPLKSDNKVAIDMTMKSIVIFEIARKKGELLVMLQSANEEPYSFILQGIEQPVKKKKKKKKSTKSTPSRENNQTRTPDSNSTISR
ncbi:MAG: prepilin-type N-terminal cleavage/methylation domain-containing protein [Sulfurovum sp.]|nr:prepilin-type N-terminal cleavage/methylation domain-containing protein [Sulfurovum sp.]